MSELRLPLVSVVMPFHNVAAFFVESVESVRAQSYQHWELLLCDELFRAGFGDVEMELRDGWLWEVDAVAGGRPIGLVWGPGFHQREGDDLRWAAETAELVVCMGGGEPAEIELTLQLARHPEAETTLTITGPGGEEGIELGETRA